MDTIDQVTLNFSEANLFYLNLSLCFIMFGVALNLRISDFVLVLKTPKAALAGVLSQFLMLPAVTYLLILILEPQPSFALGMMMVAACPGGNVSNFMAKMAKGNTALSVSLTAVSSSLSLIMTPVNLALWAGIYPPTSHLLTSISLDFVAMLKTILIILIIPIVLGMLVRSYLSKVADKINSIMHYGSILIFALIVFLAFKANFDIFMAYYHLIIVLVIIHNAVALTGGYQLARLFKLPPQDRRSIAIETGIQNSGLGLILIFSFFEGLGGMAIITAWWGIWHIISGLSISFYWNRKES